MYKTLHLYRIYNIKRRKKIRKPPHDICQLKNKNPGLVLIFAQPHDVLGDLKKIVYSVFSLRQLAPDYQCLVSPKPNNMGNELLCITWDSWRRGALCPFKKGMDMRLCPLSSRNPESCISHSKITLGRISQYLHRLLGEPTPQVFPAAACSHRATPEKLDSLSTSSRHCPSSSCLPFLPKKGWTCNLLGSLFQ